MVGTQALQTWQLFQTNSHLRTLIGQQEAEQFRQVFIKNARQRLVEMARLLQSSVQMIEAQPQNAVWNCAIFDRFLRSVSPENLDSLEDMRFYHEQQDLAGSILTAVGETMPAESIREIFDASENRERAEVLRNLLNWREIHDRVKGFFAQRIIFNGRPNWRNWAEVAFMVGMPASFPACAAFGASPKAHGFAVTLGWLLLGLAIAGAVFVANWALDIKKNTIAELRPLAQETEIAIGEGITKRDSREMVEVYIARAEQEGLDIRRLNKRQLQQMLADILANVHDVVHRYQIGINLGAFRRFLDGRQHLA